MLRVILDPAWRAALCCVAATNCPVALCPLEQSQFRETSGIANALILCVLLARCAFSFEQALGGLDNVVIARAKVDLHRALNDHRHEFL
jgi:hypothetical protein